jgi:hypothetical protein
LASKIGTLGTLGTGDCIRSISDCCIVKLGKEISGGDVSTPCGLPLVKILAMVDASKAGDRGNWGASFAGAGCELIVVTGSSRAMFATTISVL